MLRNFLLCILIVASLEARAGGRILYYFSNPVDNSVSTGVDAVYLNNHMADTLVAYINRARYTIDVAQYEYSQSSSYANIATAINNAYTRGVVIRWIYDGAAYNPSLSSLNSAISKLASPTTSSYGIMHNKFVVIDANSTSADDAIVFTGSFDWTYAMFNGDYNNAVIIQDSAMAHAFTDEFNMMWGSTGVTPNSALSKFGPNKTDLGRHSFTIDGKHVELYFSPSDHTNSHIQSAISSANTDLYFGMYTFTDNADATMIVSKYTSGVYVAGIDDSYSNSYSPYSTFSSGLGSSYFKVYTGTGVYHGKFMVVDPSNTCSDPLVLTGSHNWTTSADTKNDENTLIIHNDTAANIYYQSFRANFTSLGGSLSIPGGCGALDIAALTPSDNFAVYPDPSAGSVTVSYQLAGAQQVSIDVVNMLGQRVAAIAANEQQQAGAHSVQCHISTPGIYFVRFISGVDRFTKRLIVTAN